MDTKRLGNIKTDVPLLGFGCMRLPVVEGDMAKIDEAAAKAMVEKALASGVNYFDTAYGYHDGHSESFVGRALQGHPRESYKLATKLPMYEIDKAEQVPEIFEKQLANLQTDYIDFYLLHTMDAGKFETMKRLGIYEFVQEKKAQGKIRHLGFSFHDVPEVLDTIAGAYEWDFAQIQLNYFDWVHYRSKEQYEILEKYGIPAIIMEPLHGGLLADLRPESNAVLEAAAPGKSIASWALRYAASLPGVLTVLSGMSTMGQMEDNIATYSPYVPFTAAEEEALQKALHIYEEHFLIPCSSCRYCMPCPFGVDIPHNFMLYNTLAKDGDMGTYKAQYSFMSTEAASACTACGQCKPKCPQMLPIPELMEQMAAGKEPAALKR